MNMDSINEYIDQRYTIITATNRLARYIRSAYTERQATAMSSWETPDVLPWTAWLQRLWQRHQPHHKQSLLLLNPHQQRCIWQDVITRWPHSGNILHKSALIGEAMRSYALCKAWHIPIFPDRCYLNEDARAFKAWVAAYTKRLVQGRWLDTATLPDFLLEQGLIGEHCNNTILAGFDHLDEQQQAIIAALQQLGLVVQAEQPQALNQSVHTAAFPDADREISAAAVYARQVCAAGADEKIGVIVPDLAQQREAVISIFQRVLQPTRLLVDTANRRAAFTVSLGKPLRQYAAVQTAMTILNMAGRRLDCADLGLLLHSPYMGGAEQEAAARAGLDYVLRREGRRLWYRDNLLRTLQRLAGRGHEAPDFTRRLSAIAATLSDPADPAGQRRPADWAGLFSRLLDSAGWPGERELNSEEYQLITAWHEGMARLAGLDGLLGMIDYAQAVAQLHGIIKETRFQPETAESRVQVLNVTSAAAMQFDHLWISGLHDRAWPPAQQHYPLIPAPLRSESAMPFADTLRHYDHAKAVLETLIRSARHVVLSHAVQDNDVARSPSPLIKDYIKNHARLDGDSLTPPDGLYRAIQQTARLDYLNDTACEEVAGRPASGNTSIFTDQAKCPFRAFARHRLAAEGLPALPVGLDPMRRGSLVHLAMQFFWQELGSQEALLQLDDVQQQESLRRCVEQAMQKIVPRQPEIVTANFMRTEGRRLVSLLHEWLAHEKTRPPFTVTASEARQTTQIADIRCSMRIDRIDELADGERLILDYKTGAVNAARWFDERPEDMQLPVYAISNSERLAAVAYAHIRPGECRFSGVGRAEGLLPQVTSYAAAGGEQSSQAAQSSWEAQLASWRQTIHQLAHEFQQGVADVRPLHRQVCRQCELPTLCRIHEQQAR